MRPGLNQPASQPAVSRVLRSAKPEGKQGDLKGESLEKELRWGTSWARAERIMCNYNRDAKEGMD
jgi:hypothetical protein